MLRSKQEQIDIQALQKAWKAPFVVPYVFSNILNSAGMTFKGCRTAFIGYTWFHNFKEYRRSLQRENHEFNLVDSFNAEKKVDLKFIQYGELTANHTFKEVYTHEATHIFWNYFGNYNARHGFGFSILNVALQLRAGLKPRLRIYDMRDNHAVSEMLNTLPRFLAFRLIRWRIIRMAKALAASDLDVPGMIDFLEDQVVDGGGFISPRSIVRFRQVVASAGLAVCLGIGLFFGYAQ